MADSPVRRVRAATAPMTGVPEGGAPLTSQLLHGEAFTLERTENAFAFGRSVHDGYAGWVPQSSLGADWSPDHRVRALATLVYPAPTFKAAPLMRLSLGSPVAVAEHAAEHGFVACRRPSGYVPLAHLGRIKDPVGDWVEVAHRYVGVPYLWGGRSAEGIDCSGLVQVALMMAGVPVPRDSPDQAMAIGQAEAADAPLRRGDLVFLPGHVAIMLDASRAVHASSDPMAVVVEPIAAISARIAAREGAGITGVRRLQ